MGWKSIGPTMSYSFEDVYDSGKGIRAQFVENDVKLAIVKKMCINEATGEEIPNCAGVNARVTVNGKECGPDCDVITVPFSDASAVVLGFEAGDPTDNSFDYPVTQLERWETADGTEIQGIVERQEDFIVRPVIGCSGS